MRSWISRGSSGAPLALLLLLSGALAGAGCCGDDIRDPVIEIEGRRMVVIPFRDQVAYYYFSQRGLKVTRALIGTLRSHYKDDPDEVIEVVSLEEVVEAVGEEDPTEIAHEDMAERVGADIYLLGAITRYETSRPGDVGMLRGRAEIALMVRETENPKGMPLLNRKIKVSFPPQDYQKWGGLPTTDATEEDIDRGLTAKLAMEIGKLFRYWDPELD